MKQASAVSHHEGSGATTGGAAGSSGNDAGNAASAAKAAPKPPSYQPTTKGNAEKGAGKGVRTFLEGAYFAMPSLALPFMQPEDKVYWLLDSGSSYHVVSKQTLETGHVKILSKRKMPKTVCQTATGDLVEVGSDTHATIEVNFLTTRPLEKQGDVLSTFACTCRLEAIVSDQIRHNLINLNLLCWKGWKPTLYEGLLTAEQKGITLYPHLYGDCTWLESVEPEHPSAMLASVSSHVGRSVGRSPQSVEKPEFLQHEQQEFLHEGHGFSRHGFSRHEHEFSREPFVHESSNMVGESAVAQLPSRVVELLQSGAVGQSGVAQLPSRVVELLQSGVVGQSGVAQLPSRVVELLQSSAVGEPCQEQHVCQDHRLCQDVSRMFSASPPATSSGPGPVQQSARCISEALHGMSSESLLGMSVGRSVGRAGGCTGDVDAVSQHVESSASCETPWPEHPSEVPEVLGHHAPSQQVEAGATHSGAIHLRPTIEYDSVRDRVEHGGTKDGTFLPSVSDPERGVVHNAALGPLAVGVPEVLSPVLQGGYLRSYDDRCAQPKHQRLETSRMSPAAHCSGPLYRQPEVGDGLASLPADLHEGTGPRDQGENSSGGVVPLFGPVRGADPRRGGESGSDGGVIVSGSFGGAFELSGATLGSFDKARGYMDGAATPKSRPGGAWTKPPPPPPEEQLKKKARGRTSGKPWPDTYGVALRSSALLENAAPLRPLTPRSASPQKISSSDSDDQWGVWKATGARHKDASGSQRPKTPPKSSAASVGPEAVVMEDQGARAPQTPPKPLVAPLTPPRPTSEPPLPPPRPTSEPPLPPPRPASAPLPPPPEAPGVHYAWTAATYPSGGATYSSPSGESYFTRERLGLVGEKERQLWEEARLRTASASRSVRPRRTLPQPPSVPQTAAQGPQMATQGPADVEMAPRGSAETAATSVSSSVIPGFGTILPPPAVPRDT